MQVAANIHLGADTRVEAPGWADAYLDIGAGGSDLNLFLGHDDDARLVNIDKLAEVLLAIRIRCMERLATPNPAALEMSESEARAMDGNR